MVFIRGWCCLFGLRQCFLLDFCGDLCMLHWCLLFKLECLGLLWELFLFIGQDSLKQILWFCRRLTLLQTQQSMHLIPERKIFAAFIWEWPLDREDCLCIANMLNILLHLLPLVILYMEADFIWQLVFTGFTYLLEEFILLFVSFCWTLQIEKMQ